MQNLPWRYSTQLDSQRQLFSCVARTGYIVHAFHCSCGHEKIFVASPLKTPSEETGYICPSCDNKHFYDANLANNELQWFESYNSDFELNYEQELNSDDEKVENRLVLHLPQSIDFLRQKINFAPKILISFTLYLNGTSKESDSISLKPYDQTTKEKHKKLVDEIYQFINENRDKFNLPKSEETMDMKMINYFFKHSNLKDVDFFHWENMDEKEFKEVDSLSIEKAFETILAGRKEVSVKKEIYKNYEKQIYKDQKYNPILPLIFVKNIKDPNILVKLLNLKIYKIDINTSRVKTLIEFLSMGYSEKQIYRVFLDVNESRVDAMFLNDLMFDINQVQDKALFFKDIKKPKCTLTSIHSTFSKYMSVQRVKEIAEINIENKKDNLKNCVSIDGYDVKLPHTGKELCEWGDKLENCMSSYFYDIKNENTCIYGFFKKESIKFAVEIRDGHMIQASSFGNACLSEEETKIKDRWLKIAISILD